MSAPLPPAESDLDRYIEASGESSNIDAKGPISWDGGEVSAGLAKDIAAFANSRDGGVLVIGKSEDGSGTFSLTGLSEKQAETFETTKVAQWINGRFSPPINVVCHHREYQGKRFVVITVAEFHDIPVICTKQFQQPGNPKNLLFRKGAIYVRNSNAESAPIGTVEELRTLIGIATSKRGNEMLAMFDSMLKGRPLLAAASDDEQFDEELSRIEEELDPAVIEKAQLGAWRLVVRPEQYDAERWRGLKQLEGIVRRHSVRLRDEFPSFSREVFMREWGLCGGRGDEEWTLAQSAQFLAIRPFRENDRVYECPWISRHGDPPEENRQPGTWLDFRLNTYLIFEMLLFASRLVEEYDPSEIVRVHLQATELAGRKLVSTQPGSSIPDFGECRAKYFERKIVLPIEELRAELKQISAESMKQFVDFFPGPKVSVQDMLGGIERFEKRLF